MYQHSLGVIKSQCNSMALGLYVANLLYMYDTLPRNTYHTSSVSVAANLADCLSCFKIFYVFLGKVSYIYSRFTTYKPNAMLLHVCVCVYMWQQS